MHSKSGNSMCGRFGCGHPLRGDRREGHFATGVGPCKAPTCSCRSFVGRTEQKIQTPTPWSIRTASP